MAFAVLHISDQVFADKRPARVILRQHLLQCLNDDLDDLDILLLVVAAYIVRLKQPALLLHHVDGLGMILHIEPIAHILTVAVYRQLLPLQRIVDDQRDQLLRELISAVVVGTVGDIRRKMIGVHIGFHQHIRARLAGRIRAVRRIRRRLIEIAAVLLQRTVHFIRGHMQKLLVRPVTAVGQLPRGLCTV